MKDDDETKQRRLRGDRPIKKPEHDLFGFAPFAKHAARAIDQRVTTPGLVVGILGEWGSGKSSVLNLIEHYLTTEGDCSNTTVIRFNPWWFSSSPETLLRSFFSQLVARFPANTRYLRRARRAIAKVARVLSQTPLGGWEKAFAALHKILPTSKPSVHDLRRQIDKHLGNHRPRIVIIIDDLDRLPSEEVYQVFRLVKAVADFPRFTYLMAFDADLVASAMSRYVTDQGAGYIEKIVQIPFAMPTISQGNINSVFFRELQEIVGDVADEERHRLLNLYYGGIQALIRSPRDISRFIDSVSVSYPAIREEVDLVDFVALESLRVFTPGVHQVVAVNPDYFGAAFRFRHDPKDDLSWHQEYLDALRPEQVEPVKDILRRTFPHLDSVWGNISYSGDARWRAGRRACSEAHFNTYFQWALPPEQLRASQLQQLLRGNDDEIAALLDLHLRGDSLEKLRRARILLDDLRVREANAGDSQPNLALCRALIDRADLLAGSADPRANGESDWPFEWLIDEIVHKNVAQLEVAERVAFLRQACQETPSLSVMLGFMNHRLLEHVERPDKPPIPENERLLKRADVDDLREILRKRIHQHAEDGSLLDLPLAGWIVHWWSDLDAAACSEWVSKVAENDQRLVQILRSFVSYSISSTLGDHVGRPSPMISLQHLTTIGLDPPSLRGRVEALATSLSDSDLLAVRTFLAALDNSTDR
ncbi:MAG: P-loop NTPase fold protein [Planctomycetota bacterium]